MSLATERADFLGGFTLAEGCFTSHSGRNGRRRFWFSIGLGACDADMCELLREFFDVGNVTTSPRRKPHYDDEVSFVVGSIHDLIGVIVPFMDEHLPPSHKREQYLAWRAELFDYWDHRARRPRVRTSPCSHPGCTKLQRAKGLCRHHYYEVFGR